MVFGVIRFNGALSMSLRLNARGIRLRKSLPLAVQCSGILEPACKLDAQGLRRFDAIDDDDFVAVEDRERAASRRSRSPATAGLRVSGRDSVSSA